MERKGEKEIERQGEPQRRKMREVERQVRETEEKGRQI